MSSASHSTHCHGGQFNVMPFEYWPQPCQLCHMRRLIYIVLLGLVACGGSLSDEQRKQLKEGKANQEIKRVTEAQIMEAAFKKGRDVMASLEPSNFNVDTIAQVQKDQRVVIRWMDPENPATPDIEKLLLEAYLQGAANKDSLNDNIQKIGEDSLLYTKPVTRTLPGEVTQFEGSWSVRISKKQLILSMDDD